MISAIAPRRISEKTLGPGLNYIVPFAECVAVIPSRQTYTMSIAPSEGGSLVMKIHPARTRGQEIYVDASVIFSIDLNKLIQLLSNGRTVMGLTCARPSAWHLRDAVSQFGVRKFTVQSGMNG